MIVSFEVWWAPFIFRKNSYNQYLNTMLVQAGFVKKYRSHLLWEVYQAPMTISGPALTTISGLLVGPVSVVRFLC